MNDQDMEIQDMTLYLQMVEAKVEELLELAGYWYREYMCEEAADRGYRPMASRNAWNKYLEYKEQARILEMSVS